MNNYLNTINNMINKTIVKKTPSILIYTVAFGDCYIKMAELLYWSIRKTNNFDFVVITNKDITIGNSIILKCDLKPNFAKSYIYNLLDIYKYDYILYVDSDIIATKKFNLIFNETNESGITICGQSKTIGDIELIKGSRWWKGSNIQMSKESIKLFHNNKSINAGTILLHKSNYYIFKMWHIENSRSIGSDQSSLTSVIFNKDNKINYKYFNKNTISGSSGILQCNEVSDITSLHHFLIPTKRKIKSMNNMIIKLFLNSN